MAEVATDHTHGEMDIAEHATTFHHFLKFTKWASLAIAVSVLFLSLWFCTNAGFLGAFVVGVIVLVLGILLLREKHRHGSAH
jgi:hypothetical protein